MLQNRGRRDRNRSFASSLSIGSGISVVISILLSMVLATLILNERVRMDAFEYIIPVIMFLSTVAGCTFAGKWMKQKVAIITGLTSLTYLLIMIGAGILFFDGGFHHFWTGILAIAIGCAVSCAICIRAKGSNAKRKRAYR